MDVALPRPRFARRRTLHAALGAAGAVAAAATCALTLRSASRPVDRDELVLATVDRGDVVREVAAHGALVPEERRWVVATVPARVERVLVRPGAKLAASDVIVELENPDLEIAALDAEARLEAAAFDAIRERAARRSERLAAEAALAELRGQAAQAARRGAASLELSRGGVLSTLDFEDARDRDAALSARARLEGQRLELFARDERDEERASKERVEGLRSVARFHRDRLASLRVAAEADGTLDELDVEPGQWVVPGAVLAKIARPGRLKAIVDVAEAQASEVASGEPVRIELHDERARGRVARVDPAVHAGAVRVEVEIEDGALPRAHPDESITAIIETGRAREVVRVRRPAAARAGAGAGVFLFTSAAKAERVDVLFGVASLDTIEVRAGLAPGDRIIASDTSAFDAAPTLRVR